MTLYSYACIKKVAVRKINTNELEAHNCIYCFISRSIFLNFSVIVSLSAGMSSTVISKIFLPMIII